MQHDVINCDYIMFFYNDLTLFSRHLCNVMISKKNNEREQITDLLIVSKKDAREIFIEECM